jgi:LPS export ABC transporter protein LptC
MINHRAIPIKLNCVPGRPLNTLSRSLPILLSHCWTMTSVDSIVDRKQDFRVPLLGYWVMVLFLFGFFALLLGGCRLDYGGNLEADSLSEQVPNVEILGLVQRIYHDNRLVLMVEAQASRAFQRRNLREMEYVIFTEFNSQGETVAFGQADRARLFTDTENVELLGNIQVYSQVEAAYLEGEYFYWDSDGRTITSLVDSLVSLITDDGEEISGRGFKADMRLRRIEFSQGVEGVLGNDD